MITHCQRDLLLPFVHHCGQNAMEALTTAEPPGEAQLIAGCSNPADGILGPHFPEKQNAQWKQGEILF